MSAATLVKADTDSAYDVYDAHECTAASPCLPPVASTPPPCDTEASCRPAPTPQPPVFGAPASATFSGPANPAAKPPPPAKPKTAAQIRAEKLAKALKACHRLHARAKRKSCEVRARKQYGPKKVKAKAKAKSLKGHR